MDAPKHTRRDAVRLFQVPVFSDHLLRMPSDAKEARSTFERFWSEPAGGRPYLYADVILDSGHYLRHVEFDGSGIAIRCCMNQAMADHPELFGRPAIRWCPIRSFSDGQKYEWATSSERMLFAKSEGHEITICGLPMPPALVSLIEAGGWVHPGDQVVQEVIPFLKEPVDFLSVDSMEFESSGHLADAPHFSLLFHEVRGGGTSCVPDLPWRDVSRSFFIAVNRNIGDDIGIALDFRKGGDSNPSVIASDWSDGTCKWRRVSDSLTEFLHRIGF